MGGRSAWWLTEQIPEQISALVPVSGWAGDLSASCGQMKHVAVWAFHGDRDPLIRPSSGQKPIDTLNRCDPPLESPPHITMLDDVGHGQWEKVYANQHGDTNTGGDGVLYQDIYRWMLSFRLPNDPAT